MVKFWKDPNEIKLAIMETMAEFIRQENLVGWIQGSERVNTGAIAEEMARLANENAALREQLATLSPVPNNYYGLTFDQMYKVLSETKLAAGNRTTDFKKFAALLNHVAVSFGDSEPALLHVFWMLREKLGRQSQVRAEYLIKAAMLLEDFGLAWRDNTTLGHSIVTYGLTDAGKQFLLRLRVERQTGSVEQYVLS